MKRKGLWTVVGLIVVAVALTVARADFRGGHGWCRNGWHQEGSLGHVARELKLSNAQDSQVQSIWTEEHPTVTALLKDRTSGVRQLTDAIAGGKFDGGEVQAIAPRKAIPLQSYSWRKSASNRASTPLFLNEEQRQSADGCSNAGWTE